MKLFILILKLAMGGCFRLSDKSVDSPIIDYQRLNIDSLLDLWCAGEINQIIWKFNKFCEEKGCSKITYKQLQEFFPQLRKNYPLQTFHKKIFLLLDHNNDKTINSREMLWGLSLILKLEIQRLSEVLFSLYRQGNNHYLTDFQFRQFLNQNKLLLKDGQKLEQIESHSTFSFQQFNKFVQLNFDLYKFRQIFDCTRSTQEVLITQWLQKLNGKISLNKGDVVYIIDAKWFMRWKLYMESKYSLPEIHFKDGETQVLPKRRSTLANNQSILISLLQEQKHQEKQSLVNHYKPSKIDNDHLKGQFQGQLKEDLEIYQHFVFLPEVLWKILKQQYGGGPQFKRIYPSIDVLIINQVFINLKGKFVQGITNKIQVSFDSKIGEILGLKQKGNKNFIVYKRNLGQINWNKISTEGTIAQQCVYNNCFVCKVDSQIQSAFLNRYNQSTQHKSKINYGQSLLFIERNEKFTAYVIQILQQKVKIHFKGKSQDADIILSEEQFLKIVKSSKFQSDNGSSFPGLSNLGNSCYINSVLQCIIATPIFSDFLLKQIYKELLHKHKSFKQYPVIHQLSELAKLINTSNKYIRPSALVHMIKKTLTIFDNYDQHDADQFLVSMLNQLSQELSIQKVCIGQVNSLDPISSALKQKYCPIQKFFGGIEKRVIKCEKCKNTSIKNQQFFSLGLPVPQMQYGYYFATYYPSKQEKQFKPIVLYGFKLKKTSKFRQYAETVCFLLKKSMDVLCFAELIKCQFRKHFKQIHHDKTLAQLYIQPGDTICVFEKKGFVNINKKKYIQERKKGFPKGLTQGAFIDILYYTEWQVATFISYEQERKKVKYEFLDTQHEVEQKLVAPFLSKTYYKSLYIIEVQHRKYNSHKEAFQYFLRPFIVCIPEWLKWNDVVEVINQQAFRFVDENYWQKVSSTGFSTPLGEESQLKRNGSDSELIRQKSLSLEPNMHKSQIKKQNIKQSQNQDIVFRDTDNSRIPYRIRVLNKSNQMCAICNKRIKDETLQKNKQQHTFIRYCKGCPYAEQKPISLMFDLRRIMFVLDWYHTLAINPDSNKPILDISYTKTLQQREKDKFKIQDCIKLYANIQENIQVNCQKCHHPSSSLQCLVSKTPNILVVHLKRFKYTSGYFSKIESSICCPLQIDLEKITTDKTSSKYELYGIVCHMGSGFGGHYYSYIRKGKSKWILCDDFWTKVVDDIEKELNLKHVYLLFFRKFEMDASLLTLSL